MHNALLAKQVYSDLFGHPLGLNQWLWCSGLPTLPLYDLYAVIMMTMMVIVMMVMMMMTVSRCSPSLPVISSQKDCVHTNCSCFLSKRVRFFCNPRFWFHIHGRVEIIHTLLILSLKGRFMSWVWNYFKSRRRHMIWFWIYEHFCWIKPQINFLNALTARCAFVQWDRKWKSRHEPSLQCI